MSSSVTRWVRLFWALVPLTVMSVAAPLVGLAQSAQGKSAQQNSAKARQSIYVSAATVLCLAQQGFQPTGKPVASKGKRPAGVAVYGVSGLGIGVREGDVVTDILGQPVRSAAQGIALVIAARAARRPVISGTVWRQARPIGVTVEQPYTIPDCDPRDAECWKSRCLDERTSKAKTHGSKAAAGRAK